MRRAVRNFFSQKLFARRTNSLAWIWAIGACQLAISPYSWRCSLQQCSPSPMPAIISAITLWTMDIIRHSLMIALARVAAGRFWVSISDSEGSTMDQRKHSIWPGTGMLDADYKHFSLWSHIGFLVMHYYVQLRWCLYLTNYIPRYHCTARSLIFCGSSWKALPDMEIGGRRQYFHTFWFLPVT